MADRALPTGTLTFLFTDLEGSTRLLHEIGDRYGELLETHRRLIRHAVSAHGGTEFGTGGDALFVVFEVPSAAVAAAVDAQRAIAAHPWPDDAPIRVRMGIHTGEARIVDDDYVGVALHVAARLCSAGHGGQALLSAPARMLVPNADVLELGSHHLRDVPDAIVVFQLRGDGLASDFPPLRTLSALPNNLPAPTDRCIGRDLEIVEVAELLADHRVVTLTGPGGSGKTRLALEIAASMLPEFPDGVWFVQLLVATTSDQVYALTAKELHIEERASEPLSATLEERLATRNLLLVLDNCEHLVDAAATLVEGLLRRCPTLRVLATSRELLGVRGEQAIAVSPLGVGEPTRPGDAVLLFVDRAAAVVPGFGAMTSDLPLIADICRRLDGLPLAIELAAARLQSMSLRQLVERLDDRFRLLRGGRYHRQRTLEAVVSWSYDLLDEPEQAVFRRVAGFADSFTLEGAEAVAGWGVVEQSDVAEIITHLVEKSLVVALRGGNEYRYRLLETIRHFGRNRLTHSAEADDCLAYLRAWAQIWTERLEIDMRTPRQDATLLASSNERDNLRAVYEQARDIGDLELALRIVVFAPVMSLRERGTAIGELLEDVVDVSDSLRGHALTSQAQCLFNVGLAQEGIVAARTAAGLFEGIGDRRFAVWARYFEAFSSWGYRDDDEVRALVSRLLTDFRELEEPLGLAYMLWIASQLEPDVAAADALSGEADALFRELASPFGLAHNLEGRAIIALKHQDTTSAAPLLAEAMQLVSDPSHGGCAAHVLDAVAALLTQLDRRVDAALLLGAAESLRLNSGDAYRPWELRSRELAERTLASDDLDGARDEGRSLNLESALRRAARMLEDPRVRT